MHDAKPAATLILLREASSGPPEMLMVRRDRAMAFAAGAWVWPGGRVDPEDREAATSDLQAAQIAAVREAVEEVAMPAVDPETLVPFARWLPKFNVERRFDTWFFLARAPQADWKLELQDGEIIDATWTSAQAMLDRIARGEASAIFPTLRNLERLAGFATIEEAFADAAAHPTDPITPWVETRGGVDHIVIPDGIGYPVTAEPLTTATRA
ncbi:NUDIX hydrolase [Sphingomicrobium marinum]|uniref:NUDIX hydrolase n=1 Tax=Sphingomicrobium marinum TaxID=1227950 RepID=UPI00223FEE48|nr:NUDIX domain-containing protein [Sphingomicrobium marinum]